MFEALTDILETIARVEGYVAGKSFNDLAKEPMLNDALERCIERVSEASRSIDEPTKGNYPIVPWADIASIGNHIRHRYFSLDARIIWDTATLDLPALRLPIEDMLAGLAPEP
jgi:uncharacterized protein with HEPN domain